MSDPTMGQDEKFLPDDFEYQVNSLARKMFVNALENTSILEAGKRMPKHRLTQEENDKRAEATELLMIMFMHKAQIMAFEALVRRELRIVHER